MAGGNRAGERVFEGVAGLVLRNRGIGGGTVRGVAVLRILAGVRRVAIVGVNHVTGRTATGAIFAGMIVGTGKREDRVEQARFLQAEKDGIGAEFAAEAAIAELVIGLAGIFFARGIADLRFLATAALEHAENIAGLRNLPAI